MAWCEADATVTVRYARRIRGHDVRCSQEGVEGSREKQVLPRRMLTRARPKEAQIYLLPELAGERPNQCGSLLLS
jgi:hypothetical protein